MRRPPCISHSQRLSEQHPLCFYSYNYQRAKQKLHVIFSLQQTANTSLGVKRDNEDSDDGDDNLVIWQILV